MSVEQVGAPNDDDMGIVRRSGLAEVVNGGIHSMTEVQAGEQVTILAS